MPNTSQFTRVATTVGTLALIIVIIWLRSHSPNSGVSNSHSRYRTSDVRGESAGQIPGLMIGGDSYDLSRDENAGGHTLQRHVGRTDDQLRDRLDREHDIAAASTYTDRSTAERTVAAALNGNRDRVRAWLNRNGGHPNLALQFHGRAPIGRSIRRGQQTSEPCYDAAIVLKWDGDQSFHVLTTYPEPSRRR